MSVSKSLPKLLLHPRLLMIDLCYQAALGPGGSKSQKRLREEEETNIQFFLSGFSQNIVLPVYCWTAFLFAVPLCKCVRKIERIVCLLC